MSKYSRTLTQVEISSCDAQTDVRWQKRRADGFRDRAVENSRQIDILGARGEFAASLILDISWTGKGLRKRRDLDDLIEVRTTSPGRGLLLQAWHDELCPYLLVENRHPTYSLVGWAFGFEVKREKYRRYDLATKKKTDLEPPYIRPADSLFSLTSLIAWYRSHKKTP